jgi:anti-anti-sigma factor
VAGISEAKHNKVLAASQKRDALIVTPTGDTVGFKSGDLHDELRILLSLIDGTNIKHVVVDLGGAHYYGTVVIGCITSLGQKAEEVGGGLALCNASDDMQGIMRVMKLDQKWPHCKTVRAAVKALK